MAVMGRHLVAFAGALALLATQALADGGDAKGPSSPPAARADDTKDGKGPAKATPAKKDKDAAVRPKQFGEMTPEERQAIRRRVSERGWMDRTGDFFTSKSYP